MNLSFSLKNKKAHFNFIITDTKEAGLVLKNNEIKLILEGYASFSDSYCYIKDNEVFLKNFLNRDIKLLLKKREIKKLNEKNVSGYSIVATKMYFNNRKLKLEIGLGKGKKLYDKRQTLKEKDLKRESQRYAKN